jgi:hypothetical protein
VRAGINDSLLTVGQAPHSDGHTHPEIVIEDALFPGSFVLLGAALAVFGLLFRWRGSVTAIGSPSLGTAPRSVPPLLTPIALALAITACIAALLSLGPSWGARDGSGQPLPYGFLFEHAPFFKAMRVPARLGGLVDVALVALAGIGAAVVWRWLRTRPLVARRRHLVGLGIVALLSLGILADLDAAPIPLESVDRGAEVAAVYEWLARQPDDGAVMEFPAESIFADPAGTSVRRHVGLSMYWSTYHWKPLVNGNSGFIPRAYSDMIEAFVGQLPRSDGTLTGRISHVDRQNVALLQQFGVRYLIFHRSQYHAEDWSAVIAALDAAETELERVGDFGEATVYRVYPPLMPPPAARVTMFAPTLLTPESPWAPLFVVSKPGSFPSLLALTRPSILTLTWYDARGRQLWRGEQRVPLPVVVYDEQLLCTLERCESAPDVEFPVALPAPTPTDEVWRPVEPGHYVARLTMSGDQSLACKVDLDLVEDSERVADLSPDSPYRWAECVVGEAHPVNDPGAVPFWSPLPSVAFVEGKIALEATLTTRTDEEIRAWFFLAPPGVATPWRQPAFQSEIRQRLVKAGEPAEFDWLEDVSGTVAPGVYGLTIWFHQRHGDGWSHAYGGAFQLSPVIVDPDGSVRWAGPVRLVRAGRLPRFRPGDTARLRLIVTGTSATTGCKLAWRVVRPSDSSVVAEGNAGSCEAPRIRLPARLPPDRYRLEMIASATRDERSRLSDGLTFEITVVEAEQRGMPR